LVGVFVTFLSDRKLEGPLLQNLYQNRIIFSSRSKQIWQWYGVTWAYGHLPREFNGPPSINYFSILFPFVAILLLLKIQHKATSFVLCVAAIFVLFVYDSSFSHEIWGHGTLIFFISFYFLKLYLDILLLNLIHFSKTVFFAKYNLEKYAETIALNK